MMHLTVEDILHLEKRHRANLINSITGVKSANLIGTRSEDGKENLSIVSSVVHLGSNPALIGYIQRPRGVERHTFENIVATKKYTINAINNAIIHPSHKTSARYPREKSEFEETGLTPEWLNDFYAPFVKESNIKIAMELVEVIPIPMNDTELVVGKVLEVYFPSAIYKTDGHVAVYESGTVGISGLDTYLATEKIARYSYAKPDEPIIEI